MKNWTSVVALLLTTTACVTLTPFQQGKQVEVAPAGVGHTFKQDGKRLSYGSMLDGLVANEPSREEATTARGWMYGGSALSGVGGFGIGYGLVTGLGGQKAGWTIFGGGAAFTVLGMLAAATSSRHAQAAVDIYNNGLPAAPAGASLAPWVAPVADLGGRPGAVQAGICMRF